MNKENIILEFMKDENYTPMKAKEIAILLGVPKKEYNQFTQTLKKLEEMKDSTLEANVEKEINQLQTPDEVLTYLKTIYAKEYNEENQTIITPEDIKINRTSEMTKLVEDTDKK